MKTLFQLQFRWLRGIGFGIRVFHVWSCSKHFNLLIQILNFEVGLGVSFLFPCDGSCEMEKKEDCK
jgi:hypothetical protein